jgi:signal transduction histidine kinase
VAQRRDFDEQFRLALSDGSVRHVRWVGHPAFDEAGELVEYVGAIADVTEHKLAEEMARRAVRDLARVGRAATVGQFTATITHELSQSLAAVILSADAGVRWLAVNPPNLAEVEASVRRIARDAHRANEVLTGIRSFLAGSKSQKTTLSTGDILPDVVALIQGKAGASGVQVFVSAPEKLPTFSGDRIQLQQVLVNLALNAIDAMRAVTGRLRRLDIGVAQHGDAELRFAVRDSGPGLDSTQRHRVFDAFYTTKEQGMGMGLAICRSIVQSHGGRLWVDPNAGPGATFQFTLPLFTTGA